jgi:hypothetical protein|tara:strand:- start:275 stop:490 length:216 start_codon:yes stop_codon:yes gene_type:complete
MIDDMKRKAEFYKIKKIDVHLNLKSGKFYNGKIIDVESDFLILIDRKLGEVPVFFYEIRDGVIEPFKGDRK